LFPETKASLKQELSQNVTNAPKGF